MTETDGRYVCPYCGSTYMEVLDRMIRCTQCNKAIDKKEEEE